ncbi:DUF2889 domain-containing protein [Ferrovum sp.]|uniref:DUF2889 domain-containing protein n=1 Tax=Ferrovum sp. TaxID=2609467 RepID=UPI00261AFC1D|nr:DUF2889 domain-containing protein [Ferrovum sp.]
MGKAEQRHHYAGIFSEKGGAMQEEQEQRKLLHRRVIEVNGYARPDGWYDVEGVLRDVKGHDVDMAEGCLTAGTPIHDMFLRLTVDDAMMIREAEARMTSRPYPGTCEEIVPEYSSLKGVAIAPGFTRIVRNRLGGVHGCTHLTELVGVVATVAFQTRYGTLSPEMTERPPHLDGCHALVSTGEVVARFYPHWSRARVE